MYIACPRCDWRPSTEAQWICTCGESWNAFDTRGICPGCGKEWACTQCSPAHGCGEWSDHEEWYHEEDARTVEEFLADLHRARMNHSGDTGPLSGSDVPPALL